MSFLISSVGIIVVLVAMIIQFIKKDHGFVGYWLAVFGLLIFFFGIVVN